MDQNLFEKYYLYPAAFWWRCKNLLNEGMNRWYGRLINKLIIR